MIRKVLRFIVTGVCVLGVVSSAWAQSTRGRMPDAYQIAPQSNDAQRQPGLPVLPQGVVGQPTTGSIKEYVLGVGDRLKLTVYGEDDLSGDYEIGSTGIVALPLIGNIPAAQQTIHSFEEAVRAKLSAGYLHDPRVSVQVINYRPFFILGEVTRPGSYPYVNGMTILNAIALAGGYTYRADESGVVIVHANDPNKNETKAREDATVMPGDIIRVPERFF